MTVDQWPSLEGNFLGGFQCKRRQPRLGGTQRGVQHVAASSQRAETRAREDGRKSGRIVARPLLVHLTTLQRPGEQSEHHPSGWGSGAWEEIPAQFGNLGSGLNAATDGCGVHPNHAASTVLPGAARVPETQKTLALET